MNFWRVRQYFMLYWQNILKSLRGVLGFSLLVFILPTLFAALELRPDWLALPFLIAAIILGAILGLGAMLLPFSIISSLSFGYLSAKHEWRISEVEFLHLVRSGLNRVNLILSLLILFVPSVAPLMFVGANSFLWYLIASAFLIIGGVFVASFLGTFLGYYAKKIAVLSLLQEKPKRKQKNRLEDGLEIEDYENDVEIAQEHKSEM